MKEGKKNVPCFQTELWLLSSATYSVLLLTMWQYENKKYLKQIKISEVLGW